MHADDLAKWQHDHVFDSGNAAGERGTRVVMWITAAMMVVEIAAGWFYNSMALLADGFHMSSHAVAIGLSAFAYSAARKHAKDTRFAFGTWKMEVLGGFASAIFLVCLLIPLIFAGVLSLLVFLVLFVHSFPEGFAIGTAYASDVSGLSLFVILAIGLQNVPEGTSVSSMA